MLPLSKFAFTNAGREGSVKGTLTRSPAVCAVAVIIGTKHVAAIRTAASCRLFLYMALKDTNLSIKIFDFDLWTTCTYSASGIPVTAVNEFSVATFLRWRICGQSGQWEVTVDCAVECLEAEVR